jgi:hypothetical protein
MEVSVERIWRLILEQWGLVSFQRYWARVLTPVLPIGPLLTLVLFEEVKFLETLMENTVFYFS